MNSTQKHRETLEKGKILNLPLSRVILLSSAVWLLLHIINATLVYHLEPSRYPFGTESIFRYWDAVHYTSIATSGYYTSLWAFYPLWPLSVKMFAPLVGLSSRPDIAGAILSACMFASFCLMQAKLVEQRDENLRWLVPMTAGGWLLFLFSPATYIFHTNHTESLFLLLSFGAFWASRKGRWMMAAVLAGLCSLTRNQGVVVAVVIALDGALQRKDWRERLRIFSGSGIISALLFACYPLYQYYMTGDALTFLRLQATNWRIVTTFQQWIGALWYANPWQSPNWRDNLHLLLFFLLCGVAVYFLRKKQYALALYTFLSTIAILFQGELVNMFRFGSVVFPAFFLMGDKVMRLPRPIRWSIIIAVIWFNLFYTRSYALGDWAY
jgi:Gpi18-like mannosyltransferase